MFEIFNDLIHTNILSALGLFIAVTFLGSKLFQWLGFPQVVGFIIIGFLHGPSFLNAIPLELIDQLTFVSMIALGLIGYDMGSHLHLSELRKLGRSIAFILLFEAIGTFIIVTAGVYALTKSFYTALIFGAISSATAPAATVDVLAEYDAAGPLTTSLLAVVGLDDVLSLILFSVTAVFAETIIIGGEHLSWLEMLEIPIIEIGGSLLLGTAVGLILSFLMGRMKSRHDVMAVSIGLILLSVGISQTFGFSLILTTMITGFVVVNLNEEHTMNIRFTIEEAGPVIYVLFFALVGARFQISLLPTMGLLGVLYIVLRSSGKFVGAWIGGQIGGAQKSVKNNLGFGLLSQAGVAVGLAIASAERFSALGPEGEALGTLVINVVTASTFIVQIIGPIGTKYAITRAGEVGKAKFTDDVWASEGTPE
ncbi:MAG: cation:proton antiporter [Chloroflexi bacterium]|nr:cation:proton antiporter [Chloroflexota bacterium]